MTEPTTAAGRALGTRYGWPRGAREDILAIEAEAREGYVPEDDCAHSQKVACEKARAEGLDAARAAVASLYALRAPQNADEPSFKRQALATIDALRRIE